MNIFTIGYGGRKPIEFMDTLHANGITCVVDVRLRPDRASMGIYAKSKYPDKGIEGFLASGNIKYISLIELGNIFLDLPAWRENYTVLLNLAGNLLIKRLADISEPYCLLCAEKKVRECHREIITEYLSTHIDTIAIHLQ